MAGSVRGTGGGPVIPPTTQPTTAARTAAAPQNAPTGWNVQDGFENSPATANAARSTATGKTSALDNKDVTNVDEAIETLFDQVCKGSDDKNPAPDQVIWDSEGKIGLDELKAGMDNQNLTPRARSACKYLCEHQEAFDALARGHGGKDGRVSKDAFGSSCVDKMLFRHMFDQMMEDMEKARNKKPD